MIRITDELGKHMKLTNKSGIGLVWSNSFNLAVASCVIRWNSKESDDSKIVF